METLLNVAEAELITRLQQDHAKILCYRRRLGDEYRTIYCRNISFHRIIKRLEQTMHSANKEEMSELLAERESLIDNIIALQAQKEKVLGMIKSVSRPFVLFATE